MANIPAMPRLPPGRIDPNSLCYRVTAGVNVGKIGLGDMIVGHSSISLELADGSSISVPVGQVQQVSSDQCQGIQMGQRLGGRKRKTHRKRRSQRRRHTKRNHKRYHKK